MNSEELEIISVDWQQNPEEPDRIRRQVFMDEQGVSEDEEWDGLDDTALHFVAYQDDQPVACARLLPDGKIGRMAVLAPFRNQGIGSALLRHVVAAAEQQGQQEVFLNAQVQALDFYSRAGFIAEGPEFREAGIPHQRMRLNIRTKDEGTGVVRLDGPHACLTAVQTFASDARYSLDILSDQLTPFIYANTEVVTLISALARRSRRSKVRILVRDSRPLGGVMHGLIQLAQRLPSRISARTLSEMPADPYMGYFLMDKQALVYFNEEAAFTGFSNRNARAEAKNLLTEFDHLWEHSSFTDPNLRALRL